MAVDTGRASIGRNGHQQTVDGRLKYATVCYGLTETFKQYICAYMLWVDWNIQTVYMCIHVMGRLKHSNSVCAYMLWVDWNIQTVYMCIHVMGRLKHSNSVCAYMLWVDWNIQTVYVHTRYGLTETFKQYMCIHVTVDWNIQTVYINTCYASTELFKQYMCIHVMGRLNYSNSI